MQGNSSNPPVSANNSTIPCAPPCCEGSSYPPTEEMIIENGAYRDMLVAFRLPCTVPVNTDPTESIMDEAVRRFQKQGIGADRNQIQEAIAFLLERELVHFNEEKHCFFPTGKTQSILGKLYIVICDHCGASNIKPQKGTEPIPNLIFCHRCNEIL